MSRIVPRLLTLWLSSLLPIFAADAQQMTTLVPNAVMSNAHLDFNDDGNADIFWRDNATGDNSVWLLDGGEVV